MEPLTVKLKTIVPLWTGGADCKGDRLHVTGLIGSLRWWYEALVRGMGGSACDPTSDDRCPNDGCSDKDKKYCAACELFGCTGWARKFRLRVVDSTGKLLQDNTLGKEKESVKFSLEFIPLRSITEEEKWLLTKSIKIAADYGALGGRTTRKPQTRRGVGDDYGIVQWKSPALANRPNFNNYWESFKIVASTDKPDLRHFFFIKGAFLWRRQMNALMGLSEDGQPVSLPAEYQEFLRGNRGNNDNPAVSKILFSFKTGDGRIWGYARDTQMRDEIIGKIRRQLGDDNYPCKTGEDVQNEL